MKYNNFSWQKYLLPQFFPCTTKAYKDFYQHIIMQTISLLHMNWGWENPNTVGELDEAGYVLTNNGWYDCSISYTQSANAAGDENFQYFQIIDYNIHP
ncbi:MAG TPA: hypothetical protein VHZ50_18180 [Puia sp.]|jgi:hypothetical protein|nr:hypothetical protein [Puia sp.]